MSLAMTVFKFAGISAVIYLLIASALILSQWPGKAQGGKGLDFDKLAVSEAHEVAPLGRYTARDGAELGLRIQEGAGPLVVLVHGSGADGRGYDWLAAQLASKGARVLLPDLRGHGPLANPRGDLAYMGQFEDDLADLIGAERKAGQKVVMIGHSSGGGLVARFAGGAHGAMLDGAVLLAPFLKYNAPTMRPNSGGWAHVLTRRTIGLSMLNMVGIRALNGLTSIEFNVPDGLEGMTDAYSFRLNSSYAPRMDYLKDVAALPEFLLIVGREDEAFWAAEFETVMSGATDKGTYRILDGVSHLDVISQAETVALIAAYLDGVK